MHKEMGGPPVHTPKVWTPEETARLQYMHLVSKAAVEAANVYFISRAYGEMTREQSQTLLQEGVFPSSDIFSRINQANGVLATPDEDEMLRRLARNREEGLHLCRGAVFLKSVNGTDYLHLVGDSGSKGHRMHDIYRIRRLSKEDA